MVDCESAYINTTHADFDGPHSVLASEVFPSLTLSFSFFFSLYLWKRVQDSHRSTGTPNRVKGRQRNARKSNEEEDGCGGEEWDSRIPFWGSKRGF